MKKIWCYLMMVVMCVSFAGCGTPMETEGLFYELDDKSYVKIKKFLNNIIQSELEPIRAKRKEYEKDISAVYDILKAGSENARTIAAQTLDEVKSAMKINYFNDTSLIQFHTQKYKV